MNMILNNITEFFVKHLDFMLGVVINLILIFVFCKLTDICQRKIEQNLKIKNPNSPLLNLMPVLSRITRIVIIFLLLVGFLQSFGYNVTSFIAGFGITGLAVGFAAKETLGNVFGSIGLLADKVYKTGEYIKFNDIEGTVEYINLRSTSLRTMDGFLINVPNNIIANEPVINMSQLQKRKLDISIDIEYGTSDEKIDKALNILSEIAEKNSAIMNGFSVFIDNMSPSAIVLRILAYSSTTAYIEYLKVKSGIYKEIITQFRKEEINFAFPSTSVYIEKGV